MATYQTIESDTILENIENHFRVFAGPGAGKTYWLVNHIKNVIRNSKRLSSVTGIACISYTNVAVNEIIERLGQYGEKVEVSTIHSFLYRNIVKPYLHLIKDEQGNPLVDFKRVDGHDEHRLIYPYFKEWITKLTATWIFAKKAELNTLKSCIQKFALCLMLIEQPDRSAIRAKTRYDRSTLQPLQVSLNASGRFGLEHEAFVPANKSYNYTL